MDFEKGCLHAQEEQFSKEEGRKEESVLQCEGFVSESDKGLSGDKIYFSSTV